MGIPLGRVDGFDEVYDEICGTIDDLMVTGDREIPLLPIKLYI